MVQKINTTVSMRLLNPNAAGIDIGSKSSYVALPPDRQQPVREFESFTADILEMANWLIENGIKTVAMESTGVYWMPIFQTLESRGLEVLLVTWLPRVTFIFEN